MVRFIPFLLFVLLCSVSLRPVWGQTTNAPVQIVAQTTPPAPLKLADLISSNSLKVSLLLKDLSRTGLRVYLRWTLKGPNVNATSDATNALSRTFQLAPGFVQYSGQALDQYLAFSAFSASLTTQPAGLYTLSIDVVDATFNRPVSNPAVVLFSLAENAPPLINYPSESFSVKYANPQNFAISWTPRISDATVRARVTYQIQLYELRPTDYDPNVAVQSLRPILNKVLTTPGQTSYLYSAQDPILAGQAYALRIRVIDPQGLVTFDNDGWSVVRRFVYESCPQVNNFTYAWQGTALSVTLGPAIPIHKYYTYSVFSPNDNTTPVSINTPIYAGSNIFNNLYSQISGSAKPYVISVTGHCGPNDSAIPLTLVMQRVVSTPENTTAIAASQARPDQFAFRGSANWAFLDSEERLEQYDRSLEETNRTMTGNRPGRETHPLTGATVRVYAMVNGRQGNLLGSGQTTAQGSFSLNVTATNFIQETGTKQLKLVLDHPQCLPMEKVMDYQSTQSQLYEVGAITAIARSYRFAGVAQYDPQHYTVYETVQEPRTRTEQVQTGTRLERTGFVVRTVPVYETRTVTYYETVTRPVERDVPARPIDDRAAMITLYRRVPDRPEMQSFWAYEGMLRGTLTAPAVVRGLERMGPLVSIATLSPGQVCPRLFGSDPIYAVLRVPGQASPLVQEIHGDAYVSNNQINFDYIKRLYRLKNPQAEVSGYVKVVRNGQPTPQANVRVRVDYIASDVDPSSPNSNAPNDVLTGDDGYYQIGGLPLLRDGASYQVRFDDRSLAQETITQTVAYRPNNALRSDLTLRPIAQSVIGQVVDGANKPVPYPTIRLRRSGTVVTGSKQGVFILNVQMGDDDMEVSYEGSDLNRFPLPGLRGNSLQIDQTSTRQNRLDTWRRDLSATRTIGQMNTTALTGDSLGYPATSLDGLYSLLFSQDQLPTGSDQFPGSVRDLGTVRTQSRLASLYVTVQQANGQRVPSAAIRITSAANTSTTGVTNAQGEFVYTTSDYRQPVSYTVSPGASGSVFVTQASSIAVARDQVRRLTVVVEAGTVLSGLVIDSLTRSPLANATVRIDGLDQFNTKTSTTGSYTLIVPLNRELDVRTNGQGYYTRSIIRTFTQPTVALTIALRQTDPNIAELKTLLGFDVLLTSQQRQGDNYQISGAVVNLNNSLFQRSNPNLQLNFSNLVVAIDQNGNATPAQDSVLNLDEVSFGVKLFGKIPMLVTGTQIKIRASRAYPGKGMIGAERLEFDRTLLPLGNQFNFGLPGIQLPSGLQEDLRFWPAFSSSPGFQIPGQIRFTLKGNLTPERQAELAQQLTQLDTLMARRLAMAPDAATRTRIQGEKNLVRTANQAYGYRYFPITYQGRYGVIVDLENSYIDESGFTFAGSLAFPRIPKLSISSIDITQLSLSPTFAFRSLSIAASESQPIKVSLLRWEGGVKALTISPTSLLISGYVAIKPPNSTTTLIGFENTGVTDGQSFTGDFTIGGSGINLFNSLTIVTGGTPIHVGTIGDAYQVSGSATLNISKPIVKQITIQSFDIRTNGLFSVAIAANISANLGPLTVQLTNFALSNIGSQSAAAAATDGAFHIEISGGVSVESLSQMNFNGSATLILDKPGSGRPFTGSVNNIQAGLDTPAFSASMAFSYVNKPDTVGFSATGSFQLKRGNIGVDISAHFYKFTNGFDLGAAFKAGVTLPIGPVTITQLGGGFQLRRSGSDYSFGVSILGGATVTGLQNVAALEDVTLSVEGSNRRCGNVPDLTISGSMTVKVVSFSGNLTRLGSFSLTWSACDQTIVLNAVINDVRPIPGILINAQGTLTLSYDPQNTYIAMEVDARVVPDQIPINADIRGNFVFAWNKPGGAILYDYSKTSITRNVYTLNLTRSQIRQTKLNGVTNENDVYKDLRTDVLNAVVLGRPLYVPKEDLDAAQRNGQTTVPAVIALTQSEVAAIVFDSVTVLTLTDMWNNHMTQSMKNSYGSLAQFLQRNRDATQNTSLPQMYSNEVLGGLPIELNVPISFFNGLTPQYKTYDSLIVTQRVQPRISMLQATVSSTINESKRVDYNFGPFGVYFAGSFQNQFDFTFYTDFSTTVRAKVADRFHAGFEVGGSIDIKIWQKSFSAGGAEVDVSGSIEGQYSTTNGWSLSGNFNASLSGWVGKKCSCNDWCRWGIRACLDAQVSASYNSKRTPGTQASFSLK